MIKIDKGVPMPVGTKYPWGEMEVGDSFLIPGKTIRQMSGTMTYAKKACRGKFTARTVEGGVRVWRVE